MTTLYKVSSIIYRLILTLVIPASLVGNFLTGEAGHNRDFRWFDYLFFLYLIVTVGLLTLYNNLGNEYKTSNTGLFFVVETLILISIVLGLYQLYDTFFVCKCFTNGDNISILMLSVFVTISVMVFWGLYKERQDLLKHR